MKRTIFTLLITLISCIGFAQIAQDCPAVDCPGQCGRFIDNNHDGFCDHGKLTKPAATEQKEVSEPKELQESPTENKIIESTDKKIQQPEAQPIPEEVSTEIENIEEVVEEPLEPVTEQEDTAKKKRVPITSF